MCAPSGAVSEEAQCEEDECSNSVELLEGARALAKPECRQPADATCVKFATRNTGKGMCAIMGPRHQLAVERVCMV